MSTDDLAARIDRLESIEAIKKLKHVYMQYCDLGYKPAQLGPLFADDAVWTNAVFGHHDGRKAIEAFFGGISAQIVFAAHLALNFIIDVDGDTATGKWRILMPCTMMEDGKQVSRWILGDYDEAYIRRNGTWMFKKIDFVINFNVPQGESWAGTEQVRGG
ncbi:MAG: nuclear transport factor 2 family protein [Sneathiellaceae bacterium]